MMMTTTTTTRRVQEVMAVVLLTAMVAIMVAKVAAFAILVLDIAALAVAVVLTAIVMGWDAAALIINGLEIILSTAQATKQAVDSDDDTDGSDDNASDTVGTRLSIPSSATSESDAPSGDSNSNATSIDTLSHVTHSFPDSYSDAVDDDKHQSVSESLSSLSVSNEDKALQLPSLEELLGRRDLGIINVVQALGCGTYGIVWLVRRLGYKDDFACKVLNSQMAEDSIRSEVEIMRRLNGVASVMQLLGTCQEGNTSCLLLPLGRVDMASRVDQSSGHWPLGIPGLGRRRPGLSMKEVKFYAAYILTSLRDIHERGVIHRDIKPENIMIGDDGYPLLSDFGLSEVLEPGETTYGCKGSPIYLAPEVAYDHPDVPDSSPPSPPRIAKESDMWSYGVSLFEMRTGRDSPYAKLDRDGNLDLVETLKYIARAPRFSSVPGAELLPRRTREDRQFFDLLSKLLDPDPESRLGSENNPSRLEDHHFFRGVDWAALAAKKQRAPWRPSGKIEHLPNVAVPEDHPAFQQPEDEEEEQ